MNLLHYEFDSINGSTFFGIEVFSSQNSFWTFLRLQSWLAVDPRVPKAKTMTTRSRSSKNLQA